ncbi:MAG: hypothetical protein WCO25_01575 [Candidatus Uhrbacteria bacterium]
MNVLLIVSALDLTNLFGESSSLRSEGVLDAVRGLATAVNDSDGILIAVENQNVIQAITPHLLPSRLRIIQRGAEPVLANVSVAVLIGGGTEEIVLARRIRNARIRVIPVASTGLAPIDLLVEMETNDEISKPNVVELLSNTDYPALFKRLLSS